MIAAYDKLIYFNEASKYTILRMRTDDPSLPEEARSQYTFRDRMLRFTAVGYGLPQTDSVKLEIEGDWKEGKYGLQLHVEHWHELVPPTTEGLLSYLSSGLLKGIGESTARSIVQRFGTDTLDVLEFHPEKLLEIRGITEQKLEEIKTCYAESRAMRDIMELLTPFQVTPVTAMKIYQHFGAACTDILRKSPFRLCEISGFGFRRVDTIIRKSGGDPHDPVRIHGAMICALENARQHGHLYLEVNTLISESLQFLNEPIPLPQMQVRRAEVEQKLQQMAEDNEIVSDGGRLYLPHIFMQEVETAAKAAAMLMEHTAKIDVTLPLEQVKQKLGLHLTKRQSRGVEVAMERNLSIITGGPGTGKTTVLKAIIEVYRILHPKNRIVLAAPTGKASRRMAQSTGMLDALTLHSLLGLQGDFCSKDKQDQPLQVDFLIVDEASMVDMWLAHQRPAGNYRSAGLFQQGRSGSGRQLYLRTAQGEYPRWGISPCRTGGCAQHGAGKRRFRHPVLRREPRLRRRAVWVRSADPDRSRRSSCRGNRSAKYTHCGENHRRNSADDGYGFCAH